MSFLPRQLWGERGGEIGIWVSEPRFNVLTASEDRLHILPANDRQNLSFLAKGRRELLPRKTTFVPYETLEREPLIWTQVSKNNITFLPSMQSDNLRPGLDIGTPSRFRVRPRLNGFTVDNEKDKVYVLQYLIIAVPAE